MCICCCNKCLIDRLENFLLFFHSASTTFILCCLVIIKWSNLRFKIAHLILFILMELIYLVCLIFATLLSLWRAKNEIKSKNIKEKAKTVALISFILIVSLLVIINLEIFLYFYEIFNEEKKDNYDSDNEMTDEEFFILFLTYSVLEFNTIVGIIIWYNLKLRINYDINKPIPESKNDYASSTQQTTTERKLKYEPNKRKKIKSKIEKFSSNKIYEELSNLELLSLK